jgi:hypothetical protein
MFRQIYAASFRHSASLRRRRSLRLSAQENGLYAHLSEKREGQTVIAHNIDQIIMFCAAIWITAVGFGDIPL